MTNYPNILKIRKGAAACYWVSGTEVEMIECTDADTLKIRMLGTGDDLAYDSIDITATGKATLVARDIANYIQGKGKVVGVLNVNALHNVSAAGLSTV